MQGSKSGRELLPVSTKYPRSLNKGDFMSGCGLTILPRIWDFLVKVSVAKFGTEGIDDSRQWPTNGPTLLGQRPVFCNITWDYQVCPSFLLHCISPEVLVKQWESKPWKVTKFELHANFLSRAPNLALIWFRGKKKYFLYFILEQFMNMLKIFIFFCFLAFFSLGFYYILQTHIILFSGFYYILLHLNFA